MKIMGRIPKGRILVRMDEAHATIGGIILLGSGTKENTGTVIQSGIDNVTEGRKIALHENSGTKITIDGREYISAPESAIILITKK